MAAIDGDLPTYRELGQANGKGYEEVADALTGLKSSMPIAAISTSRL